MSATYREPEEGEWVRPVMRGYKMACCDCGLVHNVDFRVSEDLERVELRVFRNNRSTGQMRRWSNTTVNKVYEDD